MRGSTTLPKDLLIFKPFSSNTNPCVTTLEYGAFPVPKEVSKSVSSQLQQAIILFKIIDDFEYEKRITLANKQKK